jgi:hypothetical protein
MIQPGGVVDMDGNLLVVRMEWAQVEPLMRRALAIAEPSIGKRPPDIAATLSNLAALLQALSELRVRGPDRLKAELQTVRP